MKKSPLGDIIPDLAQEKKLCRFPLVAEPSEEGQRNQTTDPHQNVNNPGKQSTWTKQEGNQVEFKRSDQTPVDGADDDQKQSNSIDHFHNIDPPGS